MIRFKGNPDYWKPEDVKLDNLRAYLADGRLVTPVPETAALAG